MLINVPFRYREECLYGPDALYPGHVMAIEIYEDRLLIDVPDKSREANFVLGIATRNDYGQLDLKNKNYFRQTKKGIPFLMKGDYFEIDGALYRRHYDSQHFELYPHQFAHFSRPRGASREHFAYGFYISSTIGRCFPERIDSPSVGTMTLLSGVSEADLNAAERQSLRPFTQKRISEQLANAVVIDGHVAFKCQTPRVSANPTIHECDFTSSSHHRGGDWSEPVSLCDEWALYSIKGFGPLLRHMHALYFPKPKALKVEHDPGVRR